MSDESSAADDYAIVGFDPWTKSARQMLGLMDTPAYLRRALRVQDALKGLERRCESQRSDWLSGVQMRARHWRRIAATDPAQLGQLSERQRLALEKLMDMLNIRNDSGSTTTPGRAGRVWGDLLESAQRFNQRWERFLHSLDCSRVNQLIEGYNRYYLFEKECAFRSPRLASRGYQPLPLVTPAWLLEKFPLLPDLKTD